MVFFRCLWCLFTSLKVHVHRTRVTSYAVKSCPYILYHHRDQYIIVHKKKYIPFHISHNEINEPYLFWNRSITNIFISISTSKELTKGKSEYNLRPLLTNKRKPQAMTVEDPICHNKLMRPKVRLWKIHGTKRKSPRQSIASADPPNVTTAARPTHPAALPRTDPVSPATHTYALSERTLILRNTIVFLRCA